MRNFNIYITYLFLSFSFCGMSQTEKMTLRKGNDAYHGGKPVEATNYFSKSLKEKPDYYKANFNLGDALYKTAEGISAGKIPTPNKQMTKDSAANLIYDQAAQQFEVVAKSVSNADTIQKAWHNYGNAKLKQKSFEDAILGYKKSLKLNPNDEDTRYNLAYAQRELKKQQDQQKKNDKNKDKNKEQKKDGDKPEDKKDKGDKDKGNNKNDEQKEQSQQPQMSKEQAEKMLNALKNSERKMQSLRKKKGDPGQKIKVEKDW
jgi:Ca-activated chloride channel homolog